MSKVKTEDKDSGLVDEKHDATCKCSPMIYGQSGCLAQIHGMPARAIAKYCPLLADLMFIDSGAGSGAVLFAVIYAMNKLYGKGSFNFNHIIAIDPRLSESDYHDEKLCKYKPYEMTIADFYKLMPADFDNYGVLLCWPDPDLNVDYETLLLLQPKVAVITVGYFKDFHEQAGKVVANTCAGGVDMWNKVLGPLNMNRSGSVQIGKHKYQLYARTKYTTKAGRLACLRDDKEEYNRVAALPAEQQHIYRFVYVIVREDYTIPHKLVSMVKEKTCKKKV